MGYKGVLQVSENKIEVFCTGYNCQENCEDTDLNNDCMFAEKKRGRRQGVYCTNTDVIKNLATKLFHYMEENF